MCGVVCIVVGIMGIRHHLLCSVLFCFGMDRPRDGIIGGGIVRHPLPHQPIIALPMGVVSVVVRVAVGFPAIPAMVDLAVAHVAADSLAVPTVAGLVVVRVAVGFLVVPAVVDLVEAPVVEDSPVGLLMKVVPEAVALVDNLIW